MAKNKAKTRQEQAREDQLRIFLTLRMKQRGVGKTTSLRNVSYWLQKELVQIAKTRQGLETQISGLEKKIEEMDLQINELENERAFEQSLLETLEDLPEDEKVSDHI